MSDGNERTFAPAAARNAAPIIEVLRGALPSTGSALEVASGTGQHVVAFAEAFPTIDWQPSDPDPQARSSVAPWVAHAGLGNVRPPIDLDVTSEKWERAMPGSFDAVLAINLIHIAPWAACLGLLRGAAALLPPGGVLYLYGPYFRDGAPTAPSNLAFDRALRAQDPAWGVRDLVEVVGAAEAAGLILQRVVDMPANNLSVVLTRPDHLVVSGRRSAARCTAPTRPTPIPQPLRSARRSRGRGRGARCIRPAGTAGSGRAPEPSRRR